MTIRQALFCSAFIVPGIAGPLAAVRPALGIPPAFESNARDMGAIDNTHVLPATGADAEASLPTTDLLAAISRWLAENFGLPADGILPQVRLASSARIVALRYGRLLPDQRLNGLSDNSTVVAAGREIIAVYHDATQTIYLPESWNDASPAKVSILVHEMVHHLQNRGQLKYGCPEEREKLAYAAQDKWLALSGRSLADEFDLDPFTILAKTLCMR